MNIILGATGQVGAAIVKNLAEKNVPVRAVIRDAAKANELKKQGAEVGVADYFDSEALKKAFKGGELVFVLTPETGKSKDVLGDTRKILENYRKAIEDAGIKKVVGLSSIGAQYESGTGNFLMSYMLEHAFEQLPITQVFVRPAYYYSNWLPNLPSVKEKGVLPTFYPADLQIPMNSPLDVAEFIARIIAAGADESKIYELEGPESYTSDDVAKSFAEVLGQKVKAEQIPKEKWHETLLKMDFTEDAAQNFIEMTEVVVEGRGKPEGKGANPHKLKTTLKEYFRENVT